MSLQPESEEPASATTGKKLAPATAPSSTRTASRAAVSLWRADKGVARCGLETARAGGPYLRARNVVVMAEWTPRSGWRSGRRFENDTSSAGDYGVGAASS